MKTCVTGTPVDGWELKWAMRSRTEEAFNCRIRGSTNIDKEYIGFQEQKYSSICVYESIIVYIYIF
jgi:hypothetical protein